VPIVCIVLAGQHRHWYCVNSLLLLLLLSCQDVAHCQASPPGAARTERPAGGPCARRHVAPSHQTHHR
jgi:hypothetical protein